MSHIWVRSLPTFIGRLVRIEPDLCPPMPGVPRPAQLIRDFERIAIESQDPHLPMDRRSLGVLAIEIDYDKGEVVTFAL